MYKVLFPLIVNILSDSLKSWTDVHWKEIGGTFYHFSMKSVRFIFPSIWINPLPEAIALLWPEMRNCCRKYALKPVVMIAF